MSTGGCVRPRVGLPQPSAAIAATAMTPQTIAGDDELQREQQEERGGEHGAAMNGGQLGTGQLQQRTAAARRRRW